MSINFKKGNIFNSNAQTLVNTVNCVGVMGKGIALVYKLRYPEMFDIYKKYCKDKYIDIGKLWIYRGEEGAPWVLNFPTKNHWKFPSRIEYLEKGLEKFRNTYAEQGITSIAFPLLGAHNGGLEKEEVMEVMTRYLSMCDIEVEIYEFDPSIPDDLFEHFKANWQQLDKAQIKVETKLRMDKINLITEALEDTTIRSMMDLIKLKGIGIKTMEKCFSFVMKEKNSQTTLFD
ncbi:macro domain-containing protein [Zeaxanthinibacter enoshimensis]|uniref:O-acetyl-ADP-ribose deacetylase (Regulator of RNase III) n=1 Tax=Zeaxanthinibacter enoshimensis TaxID=392009 RepID=A0A4R6TP55_9FLAO|nr:macro domain-containing protein [Zeaxanthinibacter enoshimensis]TDQ33382.1 O-acetyl-ADP-ribose deacetylase (regulator of RNase III) [Zeaxanthinibacter enoshimensis]